MASGGGLSLGMLSLLMRSIPAPGDEEGEGEVCGTALEPTPLADPFGSRNRPPASFRGDVMEPSGHEPFHFGASGLPVVGDLLICHLGWLSCPIRLLSFL